MLVKPEPKPGLAQRLDLFPSIVLSNTLICYRDHLHIHVQKPKAIVRVNEMSLSKTTKPASKYEKRKARVSKARQSGFAQLRRMTPGVQSNCLNRCIDV